MSNIDAFESVFKRALRTRYEYQFQSFERVLIISDLEDEEKEHFESQVKSYFEEAQTQVGEYATMGKDNFAPWPRLKQRLQDLNPSLIVTYRLLWMDDITVEKTLGSYIDLLSQDTEYPLLVMPHPQLYSMDHILEKAGAVLLATEHLYEDHRQVNYAVPFVREGCPLMMVHIEDEDTFTYYMKAVERIPDINSEFARESLREQLMAGPRHYSESIAEVLRDERPDIQVNIHMEFGHLISSYRALMLEHTTDLLVAYTKDDTQLAMHSIGYSLAVEFRETPVLLL